MSFIDSIYEKAKADVKTIAIPEYDNDYMMKAAVKAHHDGIANILLVGPAAEVQARADELGLDIAGIPIADPGDETFVSALLDRYAALPEKVMPKSFIAKRITSPLYLALVIEAVGDADGTLAGVNATTYEFIMAANSTIGLKPGVPTASGMLIVEAEDFGGGALIVRAAPSDVAAGEIPDVLSELAGRLLTGGSADPGAARDALLHTMACKAAIKGGQRNSPAELLKVAQAVMSGAVKYCPHGRPVAIELTRQQLEKRFGRA